MLFIHQGIKTTICVKNPSVDRFVSGGILSSGAWEPSIVTQVMRAVDTYPGAVFLDIGANIGEDTGLFISLHSGILMTNFGVGLISPLNQQCSGFFRGDNRVVKGT